jgi:hypothetical protein
MKISDCLMHESASPRYDNPPKIEKESVLILGDCQIPFHDAEFINQVKELAFSWGIKQCVWGGDILDLNALSIFLSREDNAQQELDESEVYLAELASGFDRALWLMGNHEERLFRALDAWIGADRIRKMMGLGSQVVASDYYYGLIGEEWIVSHPKNTSVIPGRVAMWLAEKYKRNQAILHDHVCGMAPTRDGSLLGISVGMCADPKRLEYVATRQNIRPEMCQGALILRYDGEKYWPHHLTRWTDFDWLKGHHEDTAPDDYGADLRG